MKGQKNITNTLGSDWLVVRRWLSTLWESIHPHRVVKVTCESLGSGEPRCECCSAVCGENSVQDCRRMISNVVVHLLRSKTAGPSVFSGQDGHIVSSQERFVSCRCQWTDIWRSYKRENLFKKHIIKSIQRFLFLKDGHLKRSSSTWKYKMSVIFSSVHADERF